MKTTCDVGRNAFRINGEEIFLYSGEVHYFRIPRRYWAKHLGALKEAGANAVSTYVPWSWHEFREGTIDLTGKTHPERDVVGFVELARRHDLHVTLKPGPYVNAEITDQGMPEWMWQNYPDVRSLDEQGNPWGRAFVTVVSPTLRRKARKWLRTFARRVVVPHQAHKQGAVLLLQLCNEVGMFEWLGGRGSYAQCNIDAWQAYLERRYPRVHSLGKLLGRDLATHKDVAPPSGTCASREDFILYTLWHDYYRWYYEDYVGFLEDALRGAGVKVPFFTNVGGWVFGRAHEFPLNGSFHRETARTHREVLYGLDHIPEFVTPSNLHDGIIANQVARELQGGKGPLYSAEMQCGSREHGVQPYPAELGLFYRLCMIHGLTGMNFYMFSQGRNPKGRGTDGPTFYWYNALNFKGERQPTYPVIKRLGHWLKNNGDALVQTRRPASLGVASYPHLFETEFLVPILQKQTNLDAGKVGLLLDPVNFRNSALFDGVIRILAKKSVPFDFTDISARTVKQLGRYKTLVLVTNEIMDEQTQRKLVSYVRDGGRLVVFPMLPEFDRSFAPCTVLRDALKIRVCGQSKSNRVYMGALRDIPTAGLPRIVSSTGCKVLAKDVNGKVVGIEKKLGKGIVRHFGFHLNYTIEEHPALWGAMIGFDRADRNARTDSDLLHVEARFAGKEGVLFVGNFHRMPVEARVWVKDPRSEGEIDIGRIQLDSLGGLLLPVQVGIGKHATLVYTQAELFERRATGSGIELTVCGQPGRPGIAVFRFRRAVASATVDGQSVDFRERDGLTTIAYHQWGEPQTLSIRFARRAIS